MVKPISELPLKQQRFAEEYAISMNAAEAAKKAGYKSPATSGARLLQNPSIVNYLRRYVNRATERNDLRLDEVIENLRDCILREAKDFADEDGKLITDVNRLSLRARRSVNGIKQEVTVLYGPNGEQIGEKIKTELKLVPKESAMDMGLKYLDAYPRQGRSDDRNKEAPMDWDSLVNKRRMKRLESNPQEADPVEEAYKSLEAIPVVSSIKDVQDVT